MRRIATPGRTVFASRLFFAATLVEAHQLMETLRVVPETCSVDNIIGLLRIIFVWDLRDLKSGEQNTRGIWTWKK